MQQKKNSIGPRMVELVLDLSALDPTLESPDGSRIRVSLPAANFQGPLLTDLTMDILHASLSRVEVDTITEELHDNITRRIIFSKIRTSR
jgi:hypothetical protein